MPQLRSGLGRGGEDAGEGRSGGRREQRRCQPAGVAAAPSARRGGAIPFPPTPLHGPGKWLENKRVG